MKISHIHTQIVRVPGDEPLAGGPAAPGSTRDFVTLTIGTDAGIEGIGATFFGGALTGALRTAVDALGELTLGEDPLRIEAIVATGAREGEHGGNQDRRPKDSRRSERHRHSLGYVTVRTVGERVEHVNRNPPRCGADREWSMVLKRMDRNPG